MIGSVTYLRVPSFATQHSLSRVLLLAGAMGLATPGLAQRNFTSFPEFESAALAALGSENLMRLEFTATGWEACLGQSWRIDAGWARWELSDYRRVLDFDAGLSIHTAQRRAGLDPERIG